MWWIQPSELAGIPRIPSKKAQVETVEARDLAEYERLKAKYDHEN